MTHPLFPGRGLRTLLLASLGAGLLAACSADAGDTSDDTGDSTSDTIDSALDLGADGYTSEQTGCAEPTGTSYALGGTLLTPSGIQTGYVVVNGDKIVAVTPTKPTDVPVTETNAIISPGFIDLHNHVAYDFLPLWNSGRRWTNRYQWARADGYKAAVKAPYNAVKAGKTGEVGKDMCEAVKYGELRGIVGGTTTIQGSVDLACTRSWARNVEFKNFCQDHIQQDVLPVTALKDTQIAELKSAFASGKTTRFFIHLAEGVDDASRKEFDFLQAKGLLQPQVVGIHSTALTDAQLALMGKAHMKIVWSPLSNLLLYGQTTNIPSAVKHGIEIALAPDWSPSGSSNVLGELKVADRVNKEKFGGLLSDKQLWQMTTRNPAQIAGLGDKIGSLAAGTYADLVVIRGDRRHPYRAIIDAKPEDVLLTTVSGKAFYGDPTMLQEIGVPATELSAQFESVQACDPTSTRLLRTRVEDPSVPGSAEALEQVTTTFGTDFANANVAARSVIPLFGCTPPPETAFR